MTMFRRARLRAAALALAVVAVTLHASSPKFFQAATQADFLKGDVENLSIDSRGQLVLGPATELVYETPSPFLWTVMDAPVLGISTVTLTRSRARGLVVFSQAASVKATAAAISYRITAKSRASIHSLSMPRRTAATGI